MNIIKERHRENVTKERYRENVIKDRKYVKQELYGLLFVELDSVYGERNFIAAYGNIKKVNLYKDECNLKGVVREYKTQQWLVKRLETIKDEFKEDVKILYID